MSNLADLERRVMAHDNSLGMDDFAKAHAKVDVLFDQHVIYLRGLMENFSRKRHPCGPRVVRTTELIGKELALPVADRN